MDRLIAARRAAVGMSVALALTAPASADAAGGKGSRKIPRGDLPGWKRVFADDFDRRLSPAKWGRYHGQPGGDPGGWWEPSHVVVRRGVLSLETYRDPRYGGRWVSGGVSSSRGVKQTYGKYEVRFRMDHGKGVSGVLLLVPVADHWPPEIDFAESGGAHSTRRGMSATLHYGRDNSQIQRSVRADFSRWHRMGVEWTPGKLVYTLDRRRWATVRSPHVPDEPMEFAIQAQAGTCGDEWAPCPDATTPSQVNLQVDWVVAYAHRPRNRR